MALTVTRCRMRHSTVGPITWGLLILVPTVAAAQYRDSLAPVGARPLTTRVPSACTTCSPFFPPRPAPSRASFPAGDPAGPRPRKPRLLWPYFTLGGAVATAGLLGYALYRDSRGGASDCIGPCGPVLYVPLIGVGAVAGGLVGGVVDLTRRDNWRYRMRADAERPVPADSTSGAP